MSHIYDLNLNMTSVECSICLEDTSKHIQCGCKSVYCIPCAREALLNTSAEPHCPSCRKGWSRDFLYEHFGTSFVNSTYRDHRRKSLLERQKALLPQSMIELAHQEENKQFERQHTELLAKVATDIKKVDIHLRDQPRLVARIKKELGKLDYPSPEFDTLSTRYDTEKDKLIQLRRDKDKLTQMRYELNQMLLQHRTQRILRSDEPKAPTVPKILCSCPLPDCRGFVLSSNHTCGVCHKKVCRDCREPLCDEHKCDPNTVETVKLLKNDTKACPKCATLINKIDGCDQMWCPQCKVAFSWSKGTIENGYIHNPHYFEYMRRTGQVIERNPRDVPHREENGQCAQPTIGRANDILYRLTYMPRLIQQGTYERLADIVAGFNHFVEYRNNLIENIQRITDDDPILRYKFLKNEVSEAQFAETIVRREKMREKKTAIRDVLDIIYTVAVESICAIDLTVYRTFIRVQQTLRNEERVHIGTQYGNFRIDPSTIEMYSNFIDHFLRNYVKQMDVVCDFANEQLIKISANYSMKCPFVWSINYSVSGLLFTDKELALLQNYNTKYRIGSGLSIRIIQNTIEVEELQKRT